MYKVPQKKAPLKQDKPVRLSRKEYVAFQDYVYSIGLCQVCEESEELDAPHHSVYGLGVKDDRSLICICLKCHDAIHRLGYDNVPKTREELEEIGRTNWGEYDKQ